VWETADPEGRRVTLTGDRWFHIVDRHRELAVGPELILDVVARPDRRTAGRQPREEWFYRRGAGPSEWIRVVVHYEDAQGLIVTAFPRRDFP
jgi:hypothetical protein